VALTCGTGSLGGEVGGSWFEIRPDIRIYVKKIKLEAKGLGLGQVVVHFPCRHKVLSSYPFIPKIFLNYSKNS
jgi:hypothetical protein